MSMHTRQLRDLADTIRYKATNGAAEDIDDIAEERFQAGSVCRDALINANLMVSELCNCIVESNYHRSAAPEHSARQFFTAVAVWAFHLHRDGCFPRGDEVRETAAVCDLIADLIEYESTAFRESHADAVKGFRRAANEYARSMHPDSSEVHQAWLRLRLHGVSDDGAARWDAFNEADSAFEFRFAVRHLMECAEAVEAGPQNKDIKLPENQDVARVANLVNAGMAVQTAAKQVAEQSEHSWGSLKSMYYAWLRSL